MRSNLRPQKLLPVDYWQFPAQLPSLHLLPFYNHLSHFGDFLDLLFLWEMDANFLLPEVPLRLR